MNNRTLTYKDSRKLPAAALILILLLPGCLHASGEQKKDRIKRNNMSEKQSTVPGEFLIILNDGGFEADIRKCFSDIKIDSISRISRNVYKVTVPEDITIESMQETADKCSIVKLVQPNYVYHALPRKPDIKK